MPENRARKLCDLVIVGAGFAGLVCARTAAMRGLKVVVLDAKPDPGARVHTTGILVKEAADEIDLPHALARRVHGVKLHTPSDRQINLFAPGYYFLTTRTAALLRWLGDEARRAGAEIRCGQRFDGADRHGDLIRIGSMDLETRYLIGADGARSRVAQCFGLGRNTRFLAGIEAGFEGIGNMDQRFLHCFMDSALAPGYIGWAAPGTDHAQIGLATNMSRRPELDRFIARTKRVFDYGAAHEVERRAGRIPCGGTVDPIGAPGVALIGDAAGLVSPMTAGGIRLAFRSGRQAAHAVSEFVFDRGPPPEQVLAAAYPTFGLKKMMRAALDLAPPNPVLDMVLSMPGMAALARRIYFHRRGAPGLSFDDFSRAMAADLSTRPHDTAADKT